MPCATPYFDGNVGARLSFSTLRFHTYVTFLSGQKLEEKEASVSSFPPSPTTP